MKFIYFFVFVIFFVIFLGSSCSNLNAENITCNSKNDYKCPSDSICYKDRCIVCPSDSILNNKDTCICARGFSYDKETNKCEKLTACNTNSQCGDSLICDNNYCRPCPSNSNKEDDTCLCDAGFDYNSEDNDCIEQAICDTNNKCDDLLICHNNICKSCPSDSTKNNDTCLCDVGFDYNSDINSCEELSSCQINDKCDGLLICYDNFCRSCPDNSTKENDTCVCGEGYEYNDETNNCDQFPLCDFDSECSDSSICYNESFCRPCPEASSKDKGTCICGLGFSYSLEKNKCVKLDECNVYEDCNDSSICYSGFCRSCPENSIRTGNNCACDEGTYYYKAKNRCETLICAPENEENTSRTLGCQDGLGYCFKNDVGVNGTCEPSKCTSHLDCTESQQCTFSHNSSDDVLVYLICQDIGVKELGEECDKVNLICAEGLSCITNQGVSLCQEVCIPGNDAEILTCSNNRTCVDFANFNKDIPSKVIGVCLSEDLSCTFADTDHYLINNESCNDKKGSCLRTDLNLPAGFCSQDECDPRDPYKTGCENEQKCIFNSQIYECKDINSNTEGTDLAPCQDSSDCNTEFSCVPDGFNSENKVCRRLCRPENIYGHSNCSEDQQCLDLSGAVSEFGLNSVGYCFGF